MALHVSRSALVARRAAALSDIQASAQAEINVILEAAADDPDKSQETILLQNLPSLSSSSASARAQIAALIVQRALDPEEGEFLAGEVEFLSSSPPRLVYQIPLAA